MEKNDLRESKKEIPVYRVSSKATKLFFKVIKATSINFFFLFSLPLIREEASAHFAFCRFPPFEGSRAVGLLLFAGVGLARNTKCMPSMLAVIQS